jgi:hypothetical protein
LNNWGIWLLTKHANAFLHDCANAIWNLG